MENRMDLELILFVAGIIAGVVGIGYGLRLIKGDMATRKPRLAVPNRSNTFTPTLRMEHWKSTEPRAEIKLAMMHSLLSKPMGLSLIGMGVVLLSFIGWLTIYDMTTWNKSLATIFMDSRAGELMGLGIGMSALHYFLLGLTSMLIGTFVLFRNKIVPDQTVPNIEIKVEERGEGKPNNSGLVKLAADLERWSKEKP